MNDDKARIEHMIEHCRRILTKLQDVTAEQFYASQTLIEAVSFNFAVLGEAASKISTELREKYPAVSWRTIVNNAPYAPALLSAEEDGTDDVFFAVKNGTWDKSFRAEHTGTAGGWTPEGESAVALNGKNRLADIFEGSADANFLFLTDDANGDALFLDDIYTALPGNLTEQRARIAQIDEIRAGAGDDVVDLTSQRFEYGFADRDGMTVRGGLGNDTVWANTGDNMLFGDAGNDRLVGAAGNDILAGGTGNDSMHGGGGFDIFTFGENWGNDTVAQCDDESSFVTLWFASGSLDNWDADTLTYTDGTNSVTVSGVTADMVELKFGGNEAPERFEELSGLGAFADATSEKIFEEENKGMLA